MRTVRKSLLLFLWLVALFIPRISGGQETKPFAKIIGGLVTYTDFNTPEKVYVHTDKDLYTNGETIWFKAYVLNGTTHSPKSKSQVVYVELVDAKKTILAQRKLFVSSKGAAADIALPENVEDGVYTLRAYTKYMLNDEEPVLFQKKIPIWAHPVDTTNILKKDIADDAPKEIFPLETNKPVVQFFPEGGDLVAGMESVLGIKITDKNGNGLALEGKIFDQNGSLVSVFESHEFGLGRAHLDVAPDATYNLRIEVEGTTFYYPLPNPLSKGYTLRVVNLGTHLKIRAATNIAQGLQGALLIGHLRGKLIFKQVLQKHIEESYSLKLLTSRLQDGIAHFTLFTANGEPVCERLTFIENIGNDTGFSVKTDKSSYGLRTKVRVDMAMLEDDGTPLTGDFSMSVATQKGLGQHMETMKSWLLLNSDLGGNIPDPNFFFQKHLKGRALLLDMLMLTHGWRRFAWKSFGRGVSRALKVLPEKGIMINGRTTAFNNRYQPKKALTTLNMFAEEFSQEIKQTNAQGIFSYGPFFFQDSITTVVNAKSFADNEKSSDQVSIHIAPPFPNIKVDNQKERHLKSTPLVYAQSYLAEAQRQKITDYEYGPKITRLEEVVVKSKPKTQQERIMEELNSRTLYGAARNRIFPDSVPWMKNALSIYDLLRTVPGVQVFGAFPNQTVQIGGIISFKPIPPLFLIDGMPVNEGLMRTVSIFNIRFIDVLKYADAAIYGMRAAGGVVAVYTKRGGDLQLTPKRTPGVANAVIPGFYKAREFYAPNYAITIPGHNKPDYRTTLYWNPDVTIKSKASTTLNFYTGDSSGTYNIRIEGITSDGRPVNGLYNFRVVESLP